jgi:putative ABC transport system ATP-binding protein
VIRLAQVTKIYTVGDTEVRAVDRVSLDIPTGEFVALMGPSGCGKTTLLNLIGGIDRPTAGEVWLDGLRLDRLPENRLARLRRSAIGIVFQFFNLLPTLTAWENVAMPLLLDGLPMPEIAARVARRLDQVGLAHRAQHWPHELSGGEQQRAAVARATVADPRVILADEPTGNLDSATGGAVLELLANLHRRDRLTIVLATHNLEAARRARRIVHLRDGAIERIEGA